MTLKRRFLLAFALLCVLPVMGLVRSFADARAAQAAQATQVDQALIEGSSFPAKLSQFGLFGEEAGDIANSALRYSLRTALFSDYATKSRFVWMPPGKTATISNERGNRDNEDSITFPVGTVLVKSFGWPTHNGGKPVETRLLIHRSEGWVALPYIWDADGKDATLKLAGGRLSVTIQDTLGKERAISYAVPNKNQCRFCHERAGALVPIGPVVRNFIPDVATPATRLAALFDKPEDLLATMPRWDEPKTGTVEARARAYLDVNCAHCHNPAGSASNTGLYLEWDTHDSKKIGVGKRPVAAGRGSGNLSFAIVAGEPENSLMIYRLERLDPGIAMPEIGRSVLHREGTKLLRQWISEMPKKKHRNQKEHRDHKNHNVMPL